MTSTQVWLHNLGGVLFFVLMLRMWREGLHARYPAFFSWLALNLVSLVALRFIGYRTNAYGQVFIAATVVGWIVLYFVLRELCKLLFADHPGIAAAVRLGIWVSFGAAIAVALASWGFLPNDSAKAFPLLQVFFSLYQAVMFFLSILFAGTILFVAWFPVSLRRNTIAYCLGFSLNFLLEGVTMLARNVPALAPYEASVGLVNQCITLVILSIWIGLLNRGGEQSALSVGHRWKPEESGAVLDRLEGLNDSLANALRGPRR